MRPLVSLVDVVVANEEDLQAVLGLEVAHTEVSRGVLNVAAYRAACEQVARQVGPPRVAVTLRESRSASDNHWSAVFYDHASGGFHQSRTYALRLVDRIGAGDGFAAGLIHRLGAGAPGPDALEYAVAASALKHTIPGDFNRVSDHEVRALVAGDASGRVQR
jgi:2-dehydro-3-deoxygluconokinase